MFSTPARRKPVHVGPSATTTMFCFPSTLIQSPSRRRGPPSDLCDLRSHLISQFSLYNHHHFFDFFIWKIEFFASHDFSNIAYFLFFQKQKSRNASKREHAVPQNFQSFFCDVSFKFHFNGN